MDPRAAIEPRDQTARTCEFGGGDGSARLAEDAGARPHAWRYSWNGAVAELLFGPSAQDGNCSLGDALLLDPDVECAPATSATAAATAAIAPVHVASFDGGALGGQVPPQVDANRRPRARCDRRSLALLPSGSSNEETDIRLLAVTATTTDAVVCNFAWLGAFFAADAVVHTVTTPLDSSGVPATPAGHFAEPGSGTGRASQHWMAPRLIDPPTRGATRSWGQAPRDNEAFRRSGRSAPAVTAASTCVNDASGCCARDSWVIIKTEPLCDNPGRVRGHEEDMRPPAALMATTAAARGAAVAAATAMGTAVMCVAGSRLAGYRPVGPTWTHIVVAAAAPFSRGTSQERWRKLAQLATREAAVAGVSQPLSTGGPTGSNPGRPWPELYSAALAAGVGAFAASSVAGTQSYSTVPDIPTGLVAASAVPGTGSSVHGRPPYASGPFHTEASLDAVWWPGFSDSMHKIAAGALGRAPTGREASRILRPPWTTDGAFREDFRQYIKGVLVLRPDPANNPILQQSSASPPVPPETTVPVSAVVCSSALRPPDVPVLASTQ